MRKRKRLSPSLLKKLLEKPEESLEAVDLVYTDFRQFPISRVREEKDFGYFLGKQPLMEEAHLQRIAGLVIPPAWEDVRITDLPNGHLQAVGRDLRSRRQYRYHPKWSALRNQTKFYKMATFGAQLPAIRKQVDLDLDRKGWPREKVMALVIRLLEETHIRIGNRRYAKQNETYGLSTLRSRHVKTAKDKIRFEFKGKRGKEHRVTLRNKKLMRLVNRCEEIPGWELFKFYDSDGEKQTIDSGMVNDYIQEISNDSYTAKDFRTWGGSILFLEYLMGVPFPETEESRHKTILEAYDHTAAALGNTRAVCREYYVHPVLPDAYERGTLLETFKKAADRRKNSTYFTASEKAFLALIKTYQPVLEEL